MEQRKEAAAALQRRGVTVCVLPPEWNGMGQVCGFGEGEECAFAASLCGQLWCGFQFPNDVALQG